MESDNDNGTSSVASLASSVLNLLEQATGEADGDSTGAKGAKSGAEKSTAPTSQPVHAPPQTTAMAPPPPPSLPPPVSATAAKGSTNSTAQASGDATNNVSGATSLTALQSTLGIKGSDADAGDDDAGGSDSATSASSLGSAAVQTIADGAQTLAATAMTAGHAVSAAIAAPASANPSQSTPDFASLRGALDATAVAPQPSSSTTAAHSLSNGAAVGSSGFAKELGQQVTWLSGQEVKQAQIRLNPESLGPLDVKVSVEHGRVDVAFTTQHPETTAAVQQGLDQLSHMLSGQGLSLGNTSVGQHAQQQQFDGSSQQPSSQTSGDADGAIEDTAASALQRVAVGLVDAFA